MRRLRRFADGAHQQAGARAIEEPLHDDEQGQRSIDQHVEAEQKRPDQRDIAQPRDRDALESLDGRADKTAADEGRQADAEQGQRKAGGNLVGLQRQREESEEQRQRHPRQHAGNEAEREAAGLAGDGEARDRATEHHAFDAKVQHARALDDKFAEARINQRRGGADRARQDRDQLFRVHAASFETTDTAAAAMVGRFLQRRRKLMNRSAASR